MSSDFSIRSLLNSNNNRIRLLETHDADSIELVRNTVGSTGETFHGVWMSGLTQTTYLGLPDTELISPLERSYHLVSPDNAYTVPRKRPLCAAFDADSGGSPWDIPALVSSLVTKGVSMIIAEDKSVAEPGSKVNSLSESSGSQGQATIQQFCEVMKDFKNSTSGRDVMITARIESFTTRKSCSKDTEERLSVQRALEDALKRARAYTAAGADAIMIHSKNKKPDEVLAFLHSFRATDQDTPLVVVPTSYGGCQEETLYDAGANVVIYANHLMRAKIRAIDDFESRYSSLARDLIRADPILDACLAARNYGCLLRNLQMRDLSPSCKEYAHALQTLACANMHTVIKMLLDGQRAGAADERLIVVKDLLAINAQQVSPVEQFMILPSRRNESRANGEFWRPTAQL